MIASVLKSHRVLIVVLAAVTAFASGCKKEQASGTRAGAPADTAAPAPLQATDVTLSPEALEELLAPIALYPDPVLAQVLTASTNPQEVLDAGNWMIANPDLEGKALTDAAKAVGFTDPILVLVQFPDVIDMMCRNLTWTEELGQAFVNDQAGMLAAAQRLRLQAKDSGHLETTKQMKVETVTQEGQTAIAITPPSKEVVYVPQYDPVAVYAPTTNVNVAPAPAPSTATTTQQSSNDDDDDTSKMIATGLLAFTAGVLIGNAIDDDYYYGYGPSMWYRPMPYYPPYPYRPMYGGGFYPAYGYNRGPTYIRNNTVIVNRNNNYFNRYDNPNARDRARNNPQSPITKARSNRNDLAKAGTQPARSSRPSAGTTESWKGKSNYAGADRGAAGNRAGSKSAKAPAARTTPKVQGTYAGMKSNPRTSADASVRASTPRASTSGAAKGASLEPRASDRGRAQPTSGAVASRAEGGDLASRPSQSSLSTRSASSPARTSGGSLDLGSSGGGSAFNTSRSGSAERQASTRGRESLSRETGSTSRGGGGRRR